MEEKPDRDGVIIPHEEKFQIIYVATPALLESCSLEV